MSETLPGFPVSDAGSAVAANDRLSSLLAASGWIVVLVDDFAAFREWERLNNQADNKLGDPVALRAQMREYWDRATIDVLPVIAWAVRSRAGEPDEVVPIVPWQMRLGPPDEIVPQRTMFRLTSESLLDEDERRFLSRDGILRRKLEWYAERVRT